MILGSVFFYIVYLVFWRHNKEIRNVASFVHNKEAFRENFESSLDELLRRGVIKERYEKTKYFYYALVSLSISIFLLCVKLISML